MKYSSPLSNLSKTDYYGNLLPTLLIKLDNREYSEEELNTIKDLLKNDLAEGFIYNLFNYKSIVLSWNYKQDIQALFKFKSLHCIIENNKLCLSCVVCAQYNISTGILAFCPAFDYKIEEYGSVTDMTSFQKVYNYFL